ncbi:hypothetical protein [Fictibacillus terranigra]|uniref:DUF4129 domain-containing protein n=1 Tax=Fictibacillus terranigra TaxID=3058424 RepID=A0ABT8ECJ8_9BACL|nr:hypothetical protein [Fictibacillus sp. CENA-BCM004]MDN4075633.1 hypothetical protein [Fictibacillus sp. CENA-BCM004]
MVSQERHLMRTHGRLPTFSFNYLFDGLLLYLLVISLLPFSLALSLKLCALYIFGCLPFVLLFNFSKKITMGKIILLSPVAFEIGFIFGFSFIHSILLAGIIGWRAWVNWSEPIKQDMEVIWLGAFALALFRYIFFPNISEALLLIPALQLVCLILLKSYHRHLNEGIPGFQNMKQGIFSLSVLLSSAAAAYLVFPLFSFLFKNLMGALFYAVFSLLSKPLFFLYSLLPVSDGRKKRAEAFAGTFMESEKTTKTPSLAPSDDQWILWLLFALLLVAVYIYFRRRILDTLGQTISTQRIQPILPGKPLTEHNKERRYWKTPSDEARKIYIQFEKRMTKLGGSRAYNESVSEWLQRLDLPGSTIHSVVSAYNKARYGGLTLPSEELASLKSGTQSLIREFKERQKEEKRMD